MLVDLLEYKRCGRCRTARAERTDGFLTKLSIYEGPGSWVCTECGPDFVQEVGDYIKKVIDKDYRPSLTGVARDRVNILLKLEYKDLREEDLYIKLDARASNPLPPDNSNAGNKQGFSGSLLGVLGWGGVDFEG